MSPEQLVLIVDDDADIRQTLAEVLLEEGFGVAVAADGMEALIALRDGLNPDLIVLDVMMPVLDGFAFRKAQLAVPMFAEIPVVFLSASTSAGRLLSETEPPAAVLTKPVPLDDLVATLQSVLLDRSVTARRGDPTLRRSSDA